MKKKHAVNMIWAGLLATCVVLVAGAQQEMIDDADVLEILQSVEASATEDTAVGTAGETDAVDSVGMETYDEEVASAVGNLISVRLNKVGLEEAINLFAQLSGANIIVPELTEAAQISVNLKDVEWRPALQSILDSYNYELYQRVSGSNVYSVRRRPAGAPEPQVVETFMLKYATVPNAAQLIRGLLPADAKVSEFASRNMIVVKSTESSLSEVRSVLSTIDKVRQQVYIESKFMELSDGAQKDLGIDWSVLQNYKTSLSVDAASYGQEDVLSDPSENITGLSTPLTEGFKQYSYLTSVLSPDQFDLVLSAMENNSGVNTISNPKIIVANEEKANISIVTKEPNLKQSRVASANANDQGPGNVVLEIDKDQPFFEYGIKLDVTPSINTTSNITVTIKPSLTREDPTRRKIIDAEADLSYPTIEEKSIETVFSLDDGQTAAIGGLTEVSESEIERKVPLLGSIPLLGRLFSWEQTINDQTETIIFVTVGLANTEQISEDIGMPQDTELARRRVIIERNSHKLRDRNLEIFEVKEDEKLDDTMLKINEKEGRRLEKRAKKLEKEGRGETAEVAAL